MINAHGATSDNVSYVELRRALAAAIPMGTATCNTP
jgi:hypothetical protein